MEARKEHKKQMSGIQVGMLLQPSKGIRDDLIRAGGKPKDHIKENVSNLRKLQRKIKEMQVVAPAAEPFKLSQFKNIPSRISNPTVVNTPQKSPSRNFIRMNMDKVKSTPPTRSPSVSSTPTSKKGEIPKYLIKRKLEWAKREQERLIALEQEKVPKGQTLLPDKERIRTLNALKERRDSIIQELNGFPLVIELNSLKTKKKLLEESLKEAEAGIKLFSRSKVYVPTSEYNKLTEE
ncbi:hypothetical protein HDV06_004131 [Boothiomyces sp. JEL0866]|nr:hypothetical protein HDV06_004131 [Boothiomyces sp. JEL0866]